jgi:PKD repeat protein
MKPVPIGILCLLMTAAFAGCFADADPAAADDHADATHDHANMTTNATNGTSGAPTIVVKISVNDTEVPLANESYAVPAGENVTFDASGSTGENLTFMWDFGDKNVSEEAAPVHSFGAAGNYTVQLMVHSGGQMAEADFPMVVASSGPPAGTILKTEKFHFTGTLAPFVQTNGPCGSTEGSDKKTYALTFPAQIDGVGAQVSKITVDMSVGTTNADSDVFIYNPAGKEIGKGTKFNAQEGAEHFVLEDEDGYAAGDYKAVVLGCTEVNGTYTLDIEVTYVAI